MRGEEPVTTRRSMRLGKGGDGPSNTKPNQRKERVGRAGRAVTTKAYRRKKWGWKSSQGLSGEAKGGWAVITMSSRQKTGGGHRHSKSSRRTLGAGGRRHKVLQEKEIGRGRSRHKTLQEEEKRAVTARPSRRTPGQGKIPDRWIARLQESTQMGELRKVSNLARIREQVCKAEQLNG